MPYGESQLVEGVLGRLNRLGPGQDVEIEDSDRITNWLPGIYADLSNRDVVTVGDPADIAPEVFIWLVDYVAAMRGPALGVLSIDGSTMKDIRETAEEMLKVVSRALPATMEMQFEAGVRPARRRGLV